jgi:hypothetical protein
VVISVMMARRSKICYNIRDVDLTIGSSLCCSALLQQTSVYFFTVVV